MWIRLDFSFLSRNWQHLNFKQIYLLGGKEPGHLIRNQLLKEQRLFQKICLLLFVLTCLLVHFFVIICLLTLTFCLVSGAFCLNYIFLGDTLETQVDLVLTRTQEFDSAY